MTPEAKIITARDIHGKEYEVEVDQLSFRPSVYAVIVRDGKVLLSKEWDGYDFPGGGIKLGEKIEDALVREVKEETGFDIAAGQLIACHDNFFKKLFKDQFVHSILLYYTATVIGGSASKEFIQESETEYMDLPEWIDLAKIPEIKFYNAVDSIAMIKQAETIKP